MASAYQYSATDKWRNVRILFAFLSFLLRTYSLATQLVSSKKVERRNSIFPSRLSTSSHKGECKVRHRITKGKLCCQAGESVVSLGELWSHSNKTAIFQWKDLCYVIKIKQKTRLILDPECPTVRTVHVLRCVLYCPVRKLVLFVL